MNNLKNREVLTILVNPAKKAALLQMLAAFEIGEVETKEQILERYIGNSPKNVPLTEEDIMQEVYQVRQNRRTNAKKD